MVLNYCKNGFGFTKFFCFFSSLYFCIFHLYSAAEDKTYRAESDHSTTPIMFIFTKVHWFTVVLIQLFTLC